MEFTEDNFLDTCKEIDHAHEETSKGKYAKQLDSLKAQVDLCDDACLGFYFGLMYSAILFRAMFRRLRDENPVPERAVAITYTMIPLAIAVSALRIVQDLSDKNEEPTSEDDNCIAIPDR